VHVDLAEDQELKIKDNVDVMQEQLIFLLKLLGEQVRLQLVIVKQLLLKDVDKEEDV
jgi:hypothetical protein